MFVLQLENTSRFGTDLCVGTIGVSVGLSAQLKIVVPGCGLAGKLGVVVLMHESVTHGLHTRVHH